MTQYIFTKLYNYAMKKLLLFSLTYYMVYIKYIVGIGLVLFTYIVHKLY